MIVKKKKKNTTTTTKKKNTIQGPFMKLFLLCSRRENIYHIKLVKIYSVMHVAHCVCVASGIAVLLYHTKCLDKIYLSIKMTV